jgi:hypothetical protein
MTVGEFLSMHRDPWYMRLLSWIGYGVTFGIASKVSKGYAAFWKPRGEVLATEIRAAKNQDVPVARDDMPAGGDKPRSKSLSGSA